MPVRKEYLMPKGNPKGYSRKPANTGLSMARIRAATGISKSKGKALSKAQTRRKS